MDVRTSASLAGRVRSLTRLTSQLKRQLKSAFAMASLHSCAPSIVLLMTMVSPRVTMIVVAMASPHVLVADANKVCHSAERAQNVQVVLVGEVV